MKRLLDSDSPLDNQAARSALISTGIIGLTVAIMKKGWGESYKVALPAGLAAALAMDYAVKRHTNHAAISASNTAAYNFLRNKPNKVDPKWLNQQMVMGFVSLGAAGYLGRFAYVARQAAQGMYDLTFQEPLLRLGDIIRLAEVIPPLIGGGAPALNLPEMPDMPMPDVPDAIKPPKRIIWSLLQHLVVVLLSVGLVNRDQMPYVRDALYGIFYQRLVRPIRTLINRYRHDTDRSDFNVLVENDIAFMFEQAQDDVITDLYSHNINLPDGPPLISVVENEHGQRVALTMNVDSSVQEIPLIHVPDQVVNNLAHTFQTNPQYGPAGTDTHIQNDVVESVLRGMISELRDDDSIDVAESTYLSSSDGGSTALPARIRGEHEPIPPGWTQAADGMYHSADGSRQFYEDNYDDLLAYIAYAEKTPSPP